MLIFILLATALSSSALYDRKYFKNSKVRCYGRSRRLIIIQFSSAEPDISSSNSTSLIILKLQKVIHRSLSFAMLYKLSTMS